MIDLKITEVIKIDIEMINYINSKTSNGYSISNIIREELGNDTPKKEIEKKRKYISKKISSAGYRFNNDKKIYEFSTDNYKSISNKNIKENDISATNESKQNTKKINENDDTNTKKINENDDTNIKKINENDDTNIKKIKRKYTKKKDKELEVKIKENPLFNELELSSISHSIDTFYHEIQASPKRVGIRLHQNIVDLFEVIEQRYGYFDSYLLMNNAISACYTNHAKLKDSNWLTEYSNFIAENSTAKKKQLSLSSCESIDNKINNLKSIFPILDRSEIVNFSLYIYAQCYLKKTE